MYIYIYMEYLKNNICKFTPLFKIDYDKKINILSSCFFKMENSGYKDFSKYVEGIKKLNNDIKNIKPQYKIRLFIDNSIYEDKKIYNQILTYENVQMVLYSCPNYIINNKHHIGLFGTMVRFFPLFDFLNNDANIVVIADIDGTNIKIFSHYLKYIYNNCRNIYDNIYLLKSGPLCRSIKYKYDFIYKQKLNPYVFALSYVSVKRINKNVLINYLMTVNEQNVFSYHTHVNKMSEENNKKYNKSFGAFIYGVDEHFLNDVLTKYLIDNKLCYVVITSWSIHDCLYNLLSSKNDLTNDEIKFIDYIFEYIKNKLNYKLEINNDMDIYEKFNILDKIMFSKDNSNSDTKYKITMILYKLLLYLKSNKNYKFIFPDGFYKLFVDNNYFGIYDIEIIRIINCKDKNKDTDIVLKQKKFNHEDIIKLKKFYKKHNN